MMSFVQKILASLDAKMEKTNSALATLWFDRRMDFIRGLTKEAVVKIEEFTAVIQSLAENPMIATATDEEKGLIQDAIVEHSSSLHQDGLKAYLIATGNTDIAEHYIDLVLALPPAFEEEILFNDPRCLQIKQAYAAIEATCPEHIQRFAEVVLATFPHLPYGKDSNGGGLRGLIEIASERGSKRPEMMKPNNGGLQAHDGNGGVRPIGRRNDSPRGSNSGGSGNRRPTPKMPMPEGKYAKPGAEFNLDDSELPPAQTSVSSGPDRTLIRDEDMPSPTPRKKNKKHEGTMAGMLAPLKAELSSNSNGTATTDQSIN